MPHLTYNQNLIGVTRHQFLLLYIQVIPMCKQVGIFLLKVCLWTGSVRRLDPTQIQNYSDSDSELLNQNLRSNEICMPSQVWKGKIFRETGPQVGILVESLEHWDLSGGEGGAGY